MVRAYRVRLQLVCGVVTLLLSVVALSTVATAEPKNIDRHSTSSYLIKLHNKGKIKREQHLRSVLAAESKKSLATDCTKVKCIALTFDDGPNPITTPQVVSILESEHVTATFFMVGSRVPGNEALLRRMHTDGDEIGNHSWSHPNLTKLPQDQVRQQIQQTQAVIVAAGVPAPTLFRPPYGAVNQAVIDATRPLTLAFWNEDPKDWAADTWQQVLVASVASAKPGGVIDMHDIYHVTANALKPLIDNLKGQQYHFVTVSQLMSSYPASGEFYGGYRP